MCGIVGIIAAGANGFTDDERATFVNGLFIDALRGTDGTGMMFGKTNGEVVVMKEASPSWEFLSNGAVKSGVQEIYTSGRWAFGHNRAATRGSKKDENTHPFIVDDRIILLQNGTYNGSHRHHKDTEVDTEAIAHVIAEHPEQLEEALQKIDAAYVLVWWDNELKTLNIIRNDQRPLWVAESKQGTVMYFSEWGMMYAAAERNGLELKKAPKEVPVGVHICFDFSGKTYKVSTKKLDITFRRPAFRSPVVELFPTTKHVNTGKNKWMETANGLSIWDREDAYKILDRVDQSHYVVGSFVEDFGTLYTMKEEAMLYETMDKHENTCLYVEWKGWRKASNKVGCSFYFLFGEVRAGVNDPVTGSTVFLVVSGTEAKVADYVANYGSLLTINRMAVCRSKDPADKTAPKYIAWTQDMNEDFVDWSLKEKAANVH